MPKPTRLLAAPAVALLLAAGCGSDDNSSSASPDTNDTAAAAESAPGIRLVTAAEGAAIQADPPEDLVVLDVRTPEEYAEGHLEGAILVDFYDPDFADQLAELDPDKPYLLYCRSGNRSGQAADIMDTLGFSNVADVDGGILAWATSGNPIVSE